jgi:arylformamidase
MSDPVFLHYDQAALDREYDNRGKVADYAAYLQRYQADLRLTPQQAGRNSPLRLTRHNPAPLLLPVGALEGAEYLRQSSALAAAWNDQVNPAEVMVMNAMNHFSIVEQLDRADSELSRMIHRQMGVA